MRAGKDQGDGKVYLNKIELPAGGKLNVGHVDEAGRDDPDVPIPVTGYDAVEHDGDLVADGYCDACPARSELSYSGKDALLLVIHQDGCSQLARIRAS